MTTAHRPTFDPARGKEALRGPAYHQRLLPAHTHLKFRQAGQGGNADDESHDLRAELLAAEAAHFAKKNGGAPPTSADDDATAEVPSGGIKRALEAGSQADGEEDFETKRRRILEESRDVDASSDEEEDEEDDDDDSDEDSDDEEAELQREMEKIRRERAEKREREERERAKIEEEARERDIALGNPLLNKPDFNMKRRWDDDDLLRSDFHKRFMSKYVR
ncbi:Cwf15/Cwc15 cell cycle control protein [Colletotrichum orchidophilum]|uniref:Cwf15/Cwc15 cell cycle control protein n=1 Tax=Colletotrichum orchidophilum TaxID=1209926 RepID=A0A1G4B2T4_9PEZI|nr:Cwf15/Cwc15 cell cycle control protein [Colletotrichum orchidophilum]OHE95666.1 Cwf15/Cwc15 cell cycle control protein [Colletotrichum orchidophilum]